MIPAYSYTRFSTKEQLKGTSQFRQDSGFADFCRRHHLDPQDDAFHDRGKSGFSGKNLEGDLGRFLATIPSLAKPSVLVIEAFDRLSRQRPDKTIALLAKILESGINLGIIFMDQIITIEDMGTYKFQMAAGAVTEAHQSSKQKSERVRQSYNYSRSHNLKKHKFPCWIDKQCNVIPEKAKVIKQIFDMALTMGNHKIVRYLNTTDITPIAAGYSSESKIRWTERFVETLLSNKQVLGLHRHRTEENGQRIQVGDVIKNYFPAVVDEDTFYAVQQARKDRKHLKQRDAKETICLFTGLWKDAKNKSNMRLVNSTHTDKAVGCFRRFSSYHDNGGGRYESWKYEEFELAFLAFMGEITTDQLDTKVVDNRLPALEGRRTELMQQVAEIKKKLKGKDFTLLLQLLEELQTELDANSLAIEEEKERLAANKNIAVGDFKKAWQVFQLNPTDGLKLRLRAIIRQLVSEIWIAIEDYGYQETTKKHLRVLSCQVFMKDGRVKMFLIWRMGRNVKIRGGSEINSAELDLRKWDGKPLIELT